MDACCVARDRKGDDDSCGFWPLRNGTKDTPSQLVQDDEELEKERSIESLQRHRAAFGSEPNLLVYMVNDSLREDARRQALPAPGGKPKPSRWCAHHIPPNTVEGVPVVNDYFVGKVIVLYKPTGTSIPPEHPYGEYFSKRRRKWEFRVQGRFKRIPKGDMFIGIVLRDFNYDQAVASHSVLARKAGMAMVKYEAYLSWGDRCEAAKKVDAELSHLVTNMTAWDQIIITPKNKSPPPLNGELQKLDEKFGQNLERKDLGLANYTKAIADVCSSITTENTYTMCFWGVSQAIDVLPWNFRIGTNISMARFFDEDPIHIAMYELCRDSESKKKNGDRHLESQKHYYLDFMFWSNSISGEHLAQRYNFLDAPPELEAFSSSVCSQDGHCEAARAAKVRTSEPGSPTGGASQWQALLAFWTNRLRWIPAHTCSSERAATK